MGRVKYYYLMITNVFLSHINGLDSEVWLIYGYIVKLNGDLNYSKKKNKEEKNSNKRAFCVF